MRTIRYLVESTYPKDGEEKISKNVEIKILFKEHMNKNSVIDPKRVSLLLGNNIVNATHTYSGMGRALTIKPESLRSNTTYRIRINAGKEGPMTVSGLYSENSYSFYFTTIGQDTGEESEEDGSDHTKENLLMNLRWSDKLEQISGSSSLGTTNESDTSSEGSLSEEEGFEVIYDPLEAGANQLTLKESFPSSGDLVELDSQMVFIFNKNINTEVLEKSIFIKKAKVNSLLENINKESMIRGTITTEGEKEEAKEFIFKPSENLLPGKEYQLVIKGDKGEEEFSDIRINFQTLFERMFADVATVRLILGAFAERLTDLELAKLINQQSNSIYQLASMMDSFNESDWAEENGVILTFPYAASQYVVYSTAYYAILGRSLESSSGMSESIKLADLSVSGSTKTSDNLKDLLELLKAEYERWWDVLQGKAEEIDPDRPNPNYTMTIATRGGVIEYPDFQTRVPFNELGGE